MASPQFVSDLDKASPDDLHSQTVGCSYVADELRLLASNRIQQSLNRAQLPVRRKPAAIIEGPRANLKTAKKLLDSSTQTTTIAKNQKTTCSGLNPRAQSSRTRPHSSLLTIPNSPKQPLGQQMASPQFVSDLDKASPDDLHSQTVGCSYAADEPRLLPSNRIQQSLNRAQLPVRRKPAAIIEGPQANLKTAKKLLDSSTQTTTIAKNQKTTCSGLNPRAQSSRTRPHSSLLTIPNSPKQPLGQQMASPQFVSDLDKASPDDLHSQTVGCSYAADEPRLLPSNHIQQSLNRAQLPVRRKPAAIIEGPQAE
ncbi:hypothetical protein L6452_35831 [Arctium lappa]|uniref:Uncharacterized protein n=1 Tax=Arctium lappa TaxID=4217 RepID=A0ACB8Y7Q3_ARCLA|nr:hypothetical protein L6452_35831 [Arctium lappa]